MIDTVKVVAMINEKQYKIIEKSSQTKLSVDNATGEIFYKIINNSLTSSYNSNLSVRVGNGSKYKFLTYYIEIEGSYHKITKGYNSHNGIYNLCQIVIGFIKIVEEHYNVKLPALQHWFLQRVDIAICYDLKTQEKVKTYINNLNCCNYPNRKLKHYEGESLYLTGSTTTLKIYNKFAEFIKHDKNKLIDTNFNILNHMDEIKGFIRFECEIKKKKLSDMYGSKYIRVNRIQYNELKNIWKKEFKKLLKLIETDFKIISNRKEVKERIYSNYSRKRAKTLYDFYLLIIMQGLQEMKRNTDKSSYYKKISDLKKIGIDFTQKLDNDLTDNIIAFNPFTEDEVL